MRVDAQALNTRIFHTSAEAKMEIINTGDILQFHMYTVYSLSANKGHEALAAEIVKYSNWHQNYREYGVDAG